MDSQLIMESGERSVADAVEEANRHEEMVVRGAPPKDYDSEIKRLREQMSEMVPKDELDKARDQVNQLNAERGELEQAYQELEGDNIKLTDGMDELQNELSRIQKAAAVITPQKKFRRLTQNARARTNDASPIEGESYHPESTDKHSLSHNEPDEARTDVRRALRGAEQPGIEVTDFVRSSPYADYE